MNFINTRSGIKASVCEDVAGIATLNQSIAVTTSTLNIIFTSTATENIVFVGANQGIVTGSTKQGNTTESKSGSIEGVITEATGEQGRFNIGQAIRFTGGTIVSHRQLSGDIINRNICQNKVCILLLSQNINAAQTINGVSPEAACEHITLRGALQRVVTSTAIKSHTAKGELRSIQ